jgi:NADPH-dependent 2,4-dienoyl-CoA reductase/sulfur reductase-like enzyme
VICSLPYGVGRRLVPEGPEATVVSLEREKRLPPETLRDVVQGTVTAIDPETRIATVRGPRGESRIRYESLILAPGAVPWIPPVEGVLRPSAAGEGSAPEAVVAVGDELVDRGRLAEGVFVLRGAGDARALDALAARAKRVAVVGTGAVGLEVIEALADRGVNVVALEALPHVTSALDGELAGKLEARLRERGVDVRLSARILAWKPGELTLESGRLPVDAVVFASGVRPRLDLARTMGLTVERGIVTDGRMRTSLPGVWALGDAAQIPDGATGRPLLPLIGTLAMRQSMTAVMDLAGMPAGLPPATVWGVSEIFGLHWGSVGWSEEAATRTGLPVFALTLPVRSRDPFMPSGKEGIWKLTVAAAEAEGIRPGQILGFQVVTEGDNPVHLAERFVDIIARRETVPDLFGHYFIHSPAHNAVDDPFLALMGMAMEKMGGPR